MCTPQSQGGVWSDVMSVGSTGISKKTNTNMTPFFMHAVDSPSDCGDSAPSSPEITTASVSPFSDHGAMPVDSPQFATLSPRRALRARKVRAFDERRVVAELAKAVEVEDKARSEGRAVVQRGFAALLALTLLLLVCFGSSGIGGSGGGSSGGSTSRTIISTSSSSNIISSSSSSFSVSVVTSPSPAMQASPAFLPLLSLLPDEYSEQEVESHAEGMRILQARTAALLDQASGLIGPVTEAVLQQSRELVARPADVWPCDDEVRGHAEGLARIGVALSLTFAQELELARGAQAQLCSVAQALHVASDGPRAFVLSGGLRRVVDKVASVAWTKAVVVFKGALHGAWEAIVDRLPLTDSL